MRVALAKALFIKPTLLLLDEVRTLASSIRVVLIFVKIVLRCSQPTNHLDIEACIFLEDLLKDYPSCLVVVSHSQDFLNGVCTDIIFITPKATLVNYGAPCMRFTKRRCVSGLVW